MSDDDFLAALSAVDAGFADYPSWQQVKQLAAVHPWTLSSRLLTPGQQSVLAFWRIFSRDDQGRSNAPMPSEGTRQQQRSRRSQQPQTNPGERLDKSIVWIHQETMRHTCASQMTERHSSLFTLESGQSGLRIYTSGRDAAHLRHYESWALV